MFGYSYSRRCQKKGGIELLPLANKTNVFELELSLEPSHCHKLYKFSIIIYNKHLKC